MSKDISRTLIIGLGGTGQSVFYDCNSCYYLYNKSKE